MRARVRRRSNRSRRCAFLPAFYRLLLSRIWVVHYHPIFAHQKYLDHCAVSLLLTLGSILRSAIAKVRLDIVHIESPAHSTSPAGMNFVVALLLLFMGEEEAFWMTATIVEKLAVGARLLFLLLLFLRANLDLINLRATYCFPRLLHTDNAGCNRRRTALHGTDNAEAAQAGRASAKV